MDSETKCECFISSQAGAGAEQSPDRSKMMVKTNYSWTNQTQDGRDLPSTNLVSFQFSGISYNDPGNGF